MTINYNQYPDYENREKIINYLGEKCPALNIIRASKSLCGRNIYAINIGNVMNNPVLFVGAFHGMEWLTTLLLFKFSETICCSLNNHKTLRGINIEKFLTKRGLTIIPCLNPDGVEISLHGPSAACRYQNLVSSITLNNTSTWQANARGVDLNHNFNADWKRLHLLEQSQGILGPSPTRYGGPHPESEPETKFLVSLAKSKKFRHAIAFHSQGEEIYWNYGENTPVRSKYLADVMSASSGYKIAQPEGLAVGGGFKDWFIQKLCKPAFTIEIGKGKNPLPLSDLNSIYNKLEEMLILATIL